MAGKKEKKAKAKAEEPEVPAVEGAEGEAPAKKKMAGKTLVLFIVLPAVLVLGGGGAAAMMLLGGKKDVAVAEGGEHGEKKAPPKKKEEKKKEGGHGAPPAGEHGAEGEGEAAAADVGTLTVGEDGDPSFYKLPKILVNLSGPEGDRPLLLQLELVLEGSDAAAFDEVPTSMPRLMDQYQTFLRELRVEDLNGSAGSYRLRLELLKRFNIVMAPAKIDAVLIEGILVQ